MVLLTAVLEGSGGGNAMSWKEILLEEQLLAVLRNLVAFLLAVPREWYRRQQCWKDQLTDNSNYLER
jgi:hypothetical protein